MRFIPLHCKSNLMLHALRRSSRKREWMRWQRGNVYTNPTIPRGNAGRQGPWGKSRGGGDSEQLTNQSRGWLRGDGWANMVVLKLGKMCSWPDRTPKSAGLFIQLLIPTRRAHGKWLPWGEKLSSALLRNYCNFAAWNVDLHAQLLQGYHRGGKHTCSGFMKANVLF